MSNFDLVEHFKVKDKAHLFQRLQPIEKVKKDTLKFPMYASEKFDGVFCCAMRKPDGTIGIFSRTGEEYLSMEHLKDSLDCFIPLIDIVIFEAYIPNKAQSDISGMCRDTKKQHTTIKAYVHSFITNDKLELTSKYSDKIGFISTAYYQVEEVLHKKVDSLEEAMELAESVWARGGEGVVLNAIDAKYQHGKRNNSMIKIKKVLSVDLQVTDIYEGKGKYKGTLGGLICRYKDGKEIKVSGMADCQRQAWWESPDSIVGKVVQIDAMAESSKGLLREPRFKGIRYDKVEADY